MNCYRGGVGCLLAEFQSGPSKASLKHATGLVSKQIHSFIHSFIFFFNKQNINENFLELLIELIILKTIVKNQKK